MGVGVHILSHITDKNRENRVFENEKFRHQMRLSFSGSLQAMEYKLKRNIKSCPMRVQCNFSILFNFAFQTKMISLVVQLLSI